MKNTEETMLSKIEEKLTKKYGGYGRRWEVGSEKKEKLYLVYESEVKEVLDMIKKLIKK